MGTVADDYDNAMAEGFFINLESDLFPYNAFIHF